MAANREKIIEWLKKMDPDDKIMLIECLIESEKHKPKYKRINIFNAEPEIIKADETDPEKIKEYYKVNSSKELTKKQAAKVIDRLSKKVDEIKESEEIKEDESLIPDNDYESQHD